MSEQASNIRPLVAGNWKMNGTKASLSEALAVRDVVSSGQPRPGPEVMICPPATLLAQLADAARGSSLAVGAQDCHIAASGAYTGDLSAELLADAGASAIIVGHSERRTDHGELDRLVRLKAEAGHRAGLKAIVCVGETAGQRQAGITLSVIARQLAGSVPASATAANTIVAYEPVWAIGTGLTPSPADVAEAHGSIRSALVDRFGNEGTAMRILYGGSVKPSNAKELLSVADVNGALVGGASLKSGEFLAIIDAYA